MKLLLTWSSVYSLFGEFIGGLGGWYSLMRYTICELFGVFRASYYPLFPFSSSWVYADKNVPTTMHFLTAALNNVIFPSGNIRNNKSCCFGQEFYLQEFYHTNKELLIALI